MAVAKAAVAAMVAVATATEICTSVEKTGLLAGFFSSDAIMPGRTSVVFGVSTELKNLDIKAPMPRFALAPIAGLLVSVAPCLR